MTIWRLTSCMFHGYSFVNLQMLCKLWYDAQSLLLTAACDLPVTFMNKAIHKASSAKVYQAIHVRVMHHSAQSYVQCIFKTAI